MSPATLVELPRREREGSITDEQVQEVHDALNSGNLGEREAVVVCTAMKNENTARNRARSLATKYHSKHGVKLSSHAVPDPDAEGKFIGAVTVKKNTDDDDTPAAPASPAGQDGEPTGDDTPPPVSESESGESDDDAPPPASDEPTSRRRR